MDSLLRTVLSVYFSLLFIPAMVSPGNSSECLRMFSVNRFNRHGDRTHLCLTPLLLGTFIDVTTYWCLLLPSENTNVEVSIFTAGSTEVQWVSLWFFFSLSIMKPICFQLQQHILLNNKSGYTNINELQLMNILLKNQWPTMKLMPQIKKQFTCIYINIVLINCNLAHVNEMSCII